MNKKSVAKIAIEAPVTSFRYPHFLIGRQPSFDMPPPSTIYGHVASAMGEFPNPGSFEFGYHFEFVSRAADLEHQHIVTAGGPRQTFEAGGRSYRTSIEATVQPHERDFLFRPRLTLYLDPPELGTAFRTPVFCMVLGRSQDLAAVVRVEEQELCEEPGAYFEHTLLPFSYRESVGFGVTVLMPHYIEPPPARKARFQRFISLRDRVFAGEMEGAEGLGARRLILRDGGPQNWWVDRSTPRHHGVHRGIVFHSCRGGA